jgi:hypothetical protein
VLIYTYVEQLEKAELKKYPQEFSAVHSVYERFLGVLCTNLTHLAALMTPLVHAELNKDNIKEENNSLEMAPALGTWNPAHHIC